MSRNPFGKDYKDKNLSTCYVNDKYKVFNKSYILSIINTFLLIKMWECLKLASEVHKFYSWD